MTAVITWYRAPMDCLTGHLEHHVYDFGGLVLTACILCAFGFAVPTGLLRRSLPAMVAAFILRYADHDRTYQSFPAANPRRVTSPDRR
jgi:hypothetical protein